VPGHEYFEELCAVAGVGEATAEELDELQEHARECRACARNYAECVAIAAREHAIAREHGLAGDAPVSAELDSESLTRRFLDRARREGLIPAPAPAALSGKASWARPSGLFRVVWQPQALRMAAMLVIGVALGVIATTWRPIVTNPHRPDAGTVATPAGERQGEAARLSGELQNSRAELQATTHELAAARARGEEADARYRVLKQRVSTAEGALAQARSDLAAAQQEVDRTRERATVAETTMAANQARVDELRPLAEESRAAQERLSTAESALAEARVRVASLTGELVASNDALERQRQLMALGRDVTDLMGARNLRIVDVMDTDPEGKDRKAFGRVFFTENKSLVFYAYDLNEARLQKAAYEYRVWARKEAEPQRAQSLGIFYSDNAAQRRWAFKCDDPKILSEIDSVFVTLERKGSKPTNPRGTQLLYAYLRGQPNHQ
jgi:hypothetical protein